VIAREAAGEKCIQDHILCDFVMTSLGIVAVVER
jgi:hypothetical protein